MHRGVVLSERPTRFDKAAATIVRWSYHHSGLTTDRTARLSRAGRSFVQAQLQLTPTPSASQTSPMEPSAVGSEQCQGPSRDQLPQTAPYLFSARHPLSDRPTIDWPCRPDYAATISFGLPFEPEDSQYGKSRLKCVRSQCILGSKHETATLHMLGIGVLKR